ncbi:Sodium, potassium, lithium and rubidium/H(+) antiporter [Actinomadura rubteroloni]|uniref:Sodium, potassium, lithium and rubidium/H(+) antiporter n=1 Tax=Actinomadura rubteroloni TaxID=1926885 RepID=A0A2P4UFL2_9ACTN|nr:Na+/H+ antiporter [Actinomadura rubteroloni]POM23829.1 Sodium, potassium, lithium and rubidium/H(+) antiporter [Actinomadura rubteroloni]
MLGLELVVVLGAAVLAGNVAGRRLRIAPPVLLLAGGVLLGFVPALRRVHLPPEAVLLLFLPALLFWESLTTSLREIRSNLRSIVLLGTLLVFATAAIVASTAHALGLPWGPAWVLGAALAPTDATAVGVLARSLPRRDVTVLRTESLINDGTALVIYGLAVGVTAGNEHFDAPRVGALLLLAYGGGTAAGLATAWLGVRVRRRLDEPLLANVTMLLTPFAAFLLAESIHASGVLSVVVCGLTVSQSGPRAGRAATRRQAEDFWSLAAFLVNGALFVLVGLEAQTAVRGLTSADVTDALLLVAAVSGVLIGARFTWLFTAPYLVRLIDRRPQQRLRRSGYRVRVVSGFSGFRGAVSLAAALAVPHTVASGRPFPDRDILVFVTFGVIVVALSQALVLPAVVRWARLPHDTGARDEHRLAQVTAIEEALDALPDVAADLGTDPELADRLRREYEHRLELLRSGDPDDPALHREEQATALRLALIARKRATVLKLRDERRIDDLVLREVQAALDIEEIRLERRR